MKYKNYGFTLVEMSMVIVIISLLISGIFTGLSVRDASILRNYISSLQKFEAGVNSFKTQYNYLPGDLPNAGSVWSSCTNSASPVGCNGNGDGIIQATVEDYRAWQHLNLANIIPGAYAGIVETPEFQPGINAPQCSLPGVSVMLRQNAYSVYGKTANALGTIVSGATYQQGAMTPIQAQTVDAKMDDGLAASGRFYAGRGADVAASAVCASADIVAATATYTLTDTTTSCRTWYWLDYQ